METDYWHSYLDTDDDKSSEILDLCKGSWWWKRIVMSSKADMYENKTSQSDNLYKQGCVENIHLF